MYNKYYILSFILLIFLVYSLLYRQNIISDDNDYIIKNSNKIYTSFGNDPLNYYKTDNSNLDGPSVNGVEGYPTKLFMFANNKISLDCCPSQYTTSSGCVCISDEQKKFIQKGGIV